MKRMVSADLKDLNKIWGLDFVRSDAGTCCNTCSDWDNPKVTEEYYQAETFLVVKFFTKGMNYRGSFKEQNELAVKYQLPEDLSIEKVCEDMRQSLIGELYEIETPASVRDCIILTKKGGR